MKKLVSKFLILTEKLHLIVYQLTLVFVLFFYTLLKFASGHQFIITNEDIIYSVILFLSFILCGLYKKRLEFGSKTKKTILYFFLVFAFITLGISLYFLCNSINFDYEFWESPIMILFVGFILPILFTWFNFYIIKNIIQELKT